MLVVLRRRLLPYIPVTTGATATTTSTTTNTAAAAVAVAGTRRFHIPHASSPAPPSPRPLATSLPLQTLASTITVAATARIKTATTATSIAARTRTRTVTTSTKRAIATSASTTPTTSTSTTKARARNMSKSSDADYTSFLEGASADQSASASSSSNKKTATQHFTSKTVDDESTVPSGIKQATSSSEAVYVSESDEPFVPVSLAFDGEELTSKTFAHATGLKEKDVESLSAKEFDPHGQYKSLIQAVEKEGKKKAGDVKVFRVALKGSRAEYWLVTLAEGGDRLVGVKAGAVES